MSDGKTAASRTVARNRLAKPESPPAHAGRSDTFPKTLEPRPPLLWLARSQDRRYKNRYKHSKASAGDCRSACSPHRSASGLQRPEPTGMEGLYCGAATAVTLGALAPTAVIALRRNQMLPLLPALSRKAEAPIQGGPRPAPLLAVHGTPPERPAVYNG